MKRSRTLSSYFPPISASSSQQKLASPLPTCLSNLERLAADGWCWFVLREEYCWLVAGGWFVVREKYRWLVADKPSEQGMSNFKMAHVRRISSSGTPDSIRQGVSV
jgi:hypothetical protein